MGDVAQSNRQTQAEKQIKPASMQSFQLDFEAVEISVRQKLVMLQTADNDSRGHLDRFGKFQDILPTY